MKLDKKVLLNPKFLIGAFVLFIVVLWMLNRSSSNSGGVVTASPAPATDNTLALAGIQATVANNQTAAALAVNNNQTAAALAAAQDTNATQVALATIAANAQDYSTNAAAAVAAAGLAEQSHEADLAAQISALGIDAQSHAADLQYQTNKDTITATVQMGQMAYDSANFAIATNAALQEQLANNQLTAFEFSTAASIIPTLKSGKRDNAYGAFLATYGGGDPTAINQLMQPNGASNGGGFNVTAAISPALAIMGSLS